MQQVVQSRSSSNGYGRRKVEREPVGRSDSKFQTGKANSGRESDGKGGLLESPSRDRLIYLTACLIGHQVEVQVTDGSVYSGIFHATNAEDFGIVLKMAQSIKDGFRGQKSVSDPLSKPPSRTLIIPANDLIQVIAKGVPVARDGLSNELQFERQQDILTDSCISQSRNVELGRELERWVPDENEPSCPDLEHVFDSPWKRGWDQFEANAALFGVKSTFSEELYTTKLERGPQMRELEKEAIRIAREIEGEDTLDLHLAEERGILLDGNIEIDEETRFSSVYRPVDDSGFDEVEDIALDSQNDETFVDTSRPVIGKPLMETNLVKTSDGTQTPSESLVRLKEDRSEKATSSPNAAELDPLHVSSKADENVSSSNELSESALPPKAQAAANSLARPGSSASSTSDRGGAASTSASRGLSSSSSVGSLSSEKSSLNPHAKEFKLNPNAKSFIPSPTSSRPSPVADSPFYYPPNVAPVGQMHGMPFGIGTPFAPQQPVIFSPQASPVPQPYYHPNGPQFGQQMMIGQPRPVLYMPYPAEMPYKGREY